MSKRDQYSWDQSIRIGFGLIDRQNMPAEVERWGKRLIWQHRRCCGHFAHWTTLSDPIRQFAHAVAEWVAPATEVPYEKPLLSVEHRPRSKTADATYHWSRSKGKGVIRVDILTSDIEVQFLSDVAHEICHHIDIWAFGLKKTYHTPAFYMRCTLLSLCLTSLAETVRSY